MKTENAKSTAQVDAVVIGAVYRTPWEPCGLFRVLEIEPLGTGCGGGPTAFGEFVGDHPCGYKDGSPGRYFVSELAGRESR